MERAIESEPQEIRLRKRRLLILAAVLVVASVPFLLIGSRIVFTVGTGRTDPDSPFRNTRRDVKYVGDAKCAHCHAQIARSFARHPMGRSFALISEQTAIPGEAKSGQALFESKGLEYSIETRDGRVFHQETRRDSSGRIATRTEAEVQYVLGSGSQGVAYLIERDGFLFESPITWYSKKKRWDLSPGFEVANYHFDRPIRPACLYCHANRARSVATSINQYRPPIFEGHAIGCERCHGPGELHAARPEASDGVNLTIVNPAHLEPVAQGRRLRAVPLDRRSPNRARWAA